MRFSISQVRPLTIALFAINAGLLTLTIWRISVGTQTKLLLATAPKPVVITKMEFAAGGEKPALVLIQGQPLFHASRHFFVPLDPAATSVTPPIPDCRLVGTFVIPGKPDVALLTYNTSGASMKVRPGDELDGWTVKSVERTRVVISFGDHESQISGEQHVQSSTPGLVRTTLQAAAPRESSRGRTLGSGGTAAASAVSLSETSDARLYRPPSP
jgi:hypothetical protein